MTAGDERVRAYSYLRCSSKGQVGGDTFERQDEVVAQLFEREGIEYVAAFPEYGVSGRKRRRAALSELMATIRSGPIKTIVVERSDRLARSVLATELILQRIVRVGGVVIEAEGGNEISAKSNPTRTLIRHVLGAVSQFTRSVGYDNMEAGKKRIKLNGRKDNPSNRRADGGRPFGVVSKRKSQDAALIALAARERKVIDRIMELRSRRLGPVAIAHWLNDNQVPTRKGNPWDYRVVSRIIKREKRNAAAR